MVRILDWMDRLRHVPLVVAAQEACRRGASRKRSSSIPPRTNRKEGGAVTRRPRGTPRHWFFGLPMEYRRAHVRCCIDRSWCPVCGALDTNCDDLCGCYAKDPDAWREAIHTRQRAAYPELAFIEDAAEPPKEASKELK